MRVLRLGDNPLAEASEAGVSGRLLHSDPSHFSYAALAKGGFDLHPLESEITDADWLLIPSRTGTVYELVHVVDRLLGPGGCPWDQAQTHETLKKHLLEEAYEVLDAIDRGSLEGLKEELGDLLLQPLMHTQMERLAGNFDIDSTADAIREKLVRRHPHVFGELDVADADEVLRNWDAIKKQEKGDEERSILEGVPNGMASLLRAYEVSKRAARAGFEWQDIESVFDKLHEEEAELRDALAKCDLAHIEAEIGDLLFTAVNIARWAKIEPEEALRKMLNRFTERFKHMERISEKPLTELSPDEWDRLWNRAKSATSAG